MAEIYSDDDFAEEVYSDADFADEPVRDAVADQNYGVGQRSAPASGFGLSAPPNPQDYPSGHRALLTNEPTSGFAEDVLRAAPGMALGAVGMSTGPGTSALLAGGGEMLRQGAVAANAALTDGKFPTALDTLGRPVLAAAEQYTGAKYLPKAFDAGKAVASKAGQYVAENLAGVGRPAYEFAKEHLGKVVAHLADTPADADVIANRIRGEVGNAVGYAKRQYDTLIKSVTKNPAYKDRTFDLSDVNKEAVDISDEFGLLPSPGQTIDALDDTSDIPGAAAFERIRNSLPKMTSANIDQVYRLQKRVNTLKRSFKGSPMGVAFGRLSNKLDDFITNKLGIDEISDANASWKAAKDLEEESASLVNANDLINYVVRTYKNPRMTGAKEKIAGVGEAVSEVGNLILEARAHDAAQAFAPLTRRLPQTGFGAMITKGFVGGAGLGIGGAAMANPLAAAAGAGLAAGIGTATSPRASLLALQAGHSIAPYYNRLAAAARPGLERLGRYGAAQLAPAALYGAASR